MAGFNFQPATRTSWVTGKATEPTKPCVACKAPATGWLSYEYQSGKRNNRIAVGYKPICAGCVEDYCSKQNAKANEPKATKAKGRRAKATKPTAEPEVAITDDEKALVKKYGGTHKIKPGSLRFAGGRAGWGAKRTVIITCCTCSAERVLATSDLQWPTTKFCTTCAKDAKKNAADKKKQTK